jgi:acetyl-CoA decarbonylase/synthase complex subunit gamma
MALTALDVYKFLPKTNCKECKFPTCLAFAMALAQKKASLDDCKHASADAKAALEGASRPPVTLVTIGSGDKKLEIGNDTVLFRHEATFVHPAGIAIEVSDTLAAADLAKAAEEIRGLSFERVGMDIAVNLVAVRADSGNAEKFAAAVKIVKEGAGLPLVLIGAKAEILEPALKLLAGEKPLICFADKDNVTEMAALAKAHAAPLAITGSGLEELAETAQKASSLGAADLVLCPKGGSLGAILQDLTRIRILALKKNFRALGYPLMAIASNADVDLEAATAATFVAKYAGIVVIKGRSRAEILPILTSRQNIYTDPQKPIQVKPGYYAVGNATATSPVLLTTNFSLTYYSVAGDVESSRIPAWVLVVDTEGTSVLTAFASDKLNADKVTVMLKEEGGIKDKVTTRRIVIPGLIAAMAAKLKDASGWEVLVGPRDSSGIPKYMKTLV